ncbi:TetR/AcrR family transcriptional regulator [Kineosporia rhizophila]|uniref:TetR/AcrR family transcriptional regulator n=1 Tax=Kineosporia TaxID=49184 RepID=UPI000B28DF68|nr:MULTISPECIES: TetR/AcrR family transcriptional regulator [Kineosporia]MCE0538943.1 TetR/AcrR family transcriptional regulator [Kineosporia rhizophila]GLY16196.1 TetR family transcriptional regulator [Kineosporia sp. NBRC 101677]
MPRRPFHHGNLRAVLLEHAETVLRERGLDALSLRELAREAGVSHGAPRSHFVDRNALIDALAVRGFTRLSEDLDRAASSRPDDWFAALRAAGAAYLAFAQNDAALHELMFAAKMDRPSEAVLEAAEGLFATLNGILRAGIAAEAFPEGEMQRLGMLLMMALQGTGALVTSRRITPEHGGALLNDAVTVLVRGVQTDHQG